MVWILPRCDNLSNVNRHRTVAISVWTKKRKAEKNLGKMSRVKHSTLTIVAEDRERWRAVIADVSIVTSQRPMFGVTRPVCVIRQCYSLNYMRYTVPAWPGFRYTLQQGNCYDAEPRHYIWAVSGILLRMFWLAPNILPHTFWVMRRNLY